LESDFFVSEEVELRTLNCKKVRADLVAVSRSEEHQKFPLAFEVKSASCRNFQKWTHVFKQAHDYVDSTISFGVFADSQVSASFVFPAPPYVPTGDQRDDTEFWRGHETAQLAGVIHMASMFRIGTATADGGTSNRFSLSFGPATLWDNIMGWQTMGLRKLQSRRVGSRTEKVSK